MVLWLFQMKRRIKTGSPGSAGGSFNVQIIDSTQIENPPAVPAANSVGDARRVCRIYVKSGRISLCFPHRDFCNVWLPTENGGST
jgi:hypothetical protein